VTVTASAAGVLDSPLTIPVTLTVNGATMSVTPTSLAFTQTLGGQIPATKTLTVSTSSTDVSFTVTATMQTGAGWLSVTVAANGTNLAPGTYTGTVTITSLSPFTTNGTVSIPVTFEVKSGTISATPASLTFTQVQNGTAPAAQKISVAGTPGALAFTAAPSITGSGNWLSVSPTSGTTPGDVNVTVNSGTLAPGTYTGKITITSTGATGSPLDVPVTLTVTAAQTVSVSTSTVNFTYVAGSTNTPAAQNVQVTSTGTGVTFTTTTTVSGGGNWLSVTPTSGTTAATLAISVNPTGLAPGNYTGTIAINSPAAATQPAASIAVNLTVQSIPKPVVSAVANAASYVNGPVSPGENIVLFGTGIGPATLTLAALSNNAFPTTLANTQVFFDNTPAPIIYARADQTSVMVPYGVTGRPTTSIRVVYQGVTSDAVTYNVVGSAPGIYTLNQAGSGQGAILNVTATTATVNAAANPAAKGSVVAIYMTGEGATSPTGPDGGVAPINGTGLFKPVLSVTATVGGVPATVLYYGSAPGIIYGVMQVNVQIPDTVAAGSNVPIVITVGGNTTQTGTSQVTLAVQ
jgi:uncharacterized protein (TIGR03437 family)